VGEAAVEDADEPVGQGAWGAGGCPEFRGTSMAARLVQAAASSFSHAGVTVLAM
jgi:hypothetical protein